MYQDAFLCAIEKGELDYDDNQAISNIEIEEVRALVANLPDKMRVVALMYYMEEMNISEIAGILGISDYFFDQGRKNNIRTARGCGMA